MPSARARTSIARSRPKAPSTWPGARKEDIAPALTYANVSVVRTFGHEYIVW